MSAWAAIAAVITVLAGIYGMNFVNMPELEWSFGYPALLLVMVGSSVVLYRKFKKSGWL
jgi:magnesium transporter